MDHSDVFKEGEMGDAVAEALRDEVLTKNANAFTHYDPIGLPDARDVENIKAIMRNHELAHPGEIKALVGQAKADRAANLNKFGSNASKDFRRVLTMPIGLLRVIEESYPLMFKNKKHLAWFVKHFPAFSTHDVW